MTFVNFITRIFSYFNTLLEYISNIFSTLISNNFIVFCLCVMLLFFLIDFQFEIIGLIPRILKFSKERDKENFKKEKKIKEVENEKK